MKESTIQYLQQGLRIDPFEGDFGDPDTKTLSDKLIHHARNDYECALCGGTIEEDHPYRKRVDRFEGRLETYRYCVGCCLAWAFQSDTDIFQPTLDRYDLQRHRGCK